jgi:hypothetical protein
MKATDIILFKLSKLLKCFFFWSSFVNMITFNMITRTRLRGRKQLDYALMIQQLDNDS